MGMPRRALHASLNASEKTQHLGLTVFLCARDAPLILGHGDPQKQSVSVIHSPCDIFKARQYADTLRCHLAP
jgi:hypothetical protein